MEGNVELVNANLIAVALHAALAFDSSVCVHTDDMWVHIVQKAPDNHPEMEDGLDVEFVAYHVLDAAGWHTDGQGAAMNLLPYYLNGSHERNHSVNTRIWHLNDAPAPVRGAWQPTPAFTPGELYARCRTLFAGKPLRLKVTGNIDLVEEVGGALSTSQLKALTTPDLLTLMQCATWQQAHDAMTALLGTCLMSADEEMRAVVGMRVGTVLERAKRELDPSPANILLTFLRMFYTPVVTPDQLDIIPEAVNVAE